MQAPILDNRLKKIAECIQPGEIVADVGCDHGYLSAYLALRRKIDFIYASDLHTKPLDSAARTIAHWNVEKQVQLLQSDGLEKIPQNVSTIIIAGMGGELIMRILEQAKWILRPNMHLVLQPMSFLPELRAFLYRHGFAIKEEFPIIDLPHYYLVLNVYYIGEKRELTDRECIVGGLRFSQTPEANLYLQYQYQKYKRIVEGLSHAKKEQKKYQLFLKRLGYFEQWKGEKTGDNGKRNL